MGLLQGVSHIVYEDSNMYEDRLFVDLKSDCNKCFGLCCVALYFSASEGFPSDKEAGKPCSNLQKDFSCSVHKNLQEKGLKGCTSYECFGAGQKVAQTTFKGLDWQKDIESAQQMFDVFPVMRQLHEMLWYLTEALLIKIENNIKNKIEHLINETEELTYLNAIPIKNLEIDIHRDKVNSLLKKVSELVCVKNSGDQRKTLKYKRTISGRLDLIGKDLRRIDLTGENLAGALLIAADLRGNNLTGTNLIGADLRDVDIRGANLTESLFITQSQINNAKGDSNTRLPIRLERPRDWCK
ncbi:MAG: pentapeptide repeat protein [Bacillales bacterium]|nr:pentapeptide repeat protein [Bacillales bacterium]